MEKTSKYDDEFSCSCRGGQICFHLPESKNKFRVENIGLSNYSRIIVPPGIWFGFKGLSKNNNLVSNLANIKHDPRDQLMLRKTFFLINGKNMKVIILAGGFGSRLSEYTECTKANG